MNDLLVWLLGGIGLVILGPIVYDKLRTRAKIIKNNIHRRQTEKRIRQYTKEIEAIKKDIEKARKDYGDSKSDFYHWIKSTDSDNGSTDDN